MGFFLRECFPSASVEDLREEAHILLYGYPGGFSYDQVKRMCREERTWFIERVYRQKEAEARAIEDAGKR